MSTAARSSRRHQVRGPRVDARRTRCRCPRSGYARTRAGCKTLRTASATVVAVPSGTLRKRTRPLLRSTSVTMRAAPWHDGVALPIANPAATFDDGRALIDAPPAKALAFPRGSAAVTPGSLTSAQVLPQRAAALAVSGDVLVDAFDADHHRVGAGDLLGTPVPAQTCIDRQPGLCVDAWQGTRGMPTLCRPALCVPAVVTAFRRGIAPQLAAARAGRAVQICGDRCQRPAALPQPSNLVTFLLAQMRVAHVQLHLPVKERRLPHLRCFVGLGVALQN